MSIATQFPGAPQVPSRFEVRGELGRGGMAVVYHAYDLVGERDVALKFLPPTEDEQARKRFQREAIDLASVFHPNIVDFYALGESHGVEFIEMEYVDGGNLASFARDCQSLGQLLEVFLQVCAGLQHIHECGVVHRDVKPANILMTREGQPKISDMGLARRELGRSQLTQDGALLGTASYLAPEQLMSHAVGPPADIYALGICLFEAVTCQHPFQADGPLAMLRAHLDEKPAAPSTILPGIPPRLDRLILAMLEKDSLQRPSTAQAVHDELRLCLQEMTPSQELLVATSPEGLLNRARMLLGDGSTEEALELLQHADLRAEDPALQALILCQVARAKVMLGDEQAGRLAVEAVAACRAGQLKYLGEALLVLGQAAISQGLWDEGLQALQEARDLIPSSRRDLQVGLMDSLASLHERGASMGHPSLSQEESKRFREIAQGLAKRGSSLSGSMVTPAAGSGSVLPPSKALPEATFSPMSLSVFDLPASKPEAVPSLAAAPVNLPQVVQSRQALVHQPALAAQLASSPPSAKSPGKGRLIALSALLLLLLSGGAYSAYSAWPAKPAILQVEAEPKGSIVLIDGKRYASPLKREMAAGVHKLKVFQQGYKVHQETVTLEPGQTLRLKANLVAASGNLKLASNPKGAKLFVNGVAKGQTPVALDGLPPKKLKIKLVKNGYKDYEGSVDVLAGETKNLSFAMEKRPPPPKPVERYYAPQPSYSSSGSYGSSSSSGSSGSYRQPQAPAPSSSSRRSYERPRLPNLNLPSRVEIRNSGVRVKFR